VSEGYPVTSVTLRTRAVELLRLAGKNYQGRRQWDPVFEAVTEGRQKPKYSACGDLGHWLLYRLGFRHHWINRHECLGWTSQVNVTRLTAVKAGGSNTLARQPEPGDLVYAGDVLVVYAHDNDRVHVMVVYGNGDDSAAAAVELRSGVHLKTCEYGQWNSSFGRPSGKLACHVVDVLHGKVLVGASPLDSVLSLDDLEQPEPMVEAHAYAAQIASEQRMLALVPSPRMRGPDVQWFAEELKRAGFNPGLPIDVFGPLCERATRLWQDEEGFPSTGTVNADSWLEMVTDG
jgi:hypothetical protein